MDTSVLKIDSRTRHKILHSPGDQHGTRPGLRHSPRTDVDGDATDIVTHQFAFAGVHSSAHINTELSDRRRDRERTSNRAGRTVERRKKAVTRGICFLAPEACQFFSHDRII